MHAGPSRSSSDRYSLAVGVDGVTLRHVRTGKPARSRDAWPRLRDRVARHAERDRHAARLATVSSERGYHDRRRGSNGPPASRPCVTLDAARYHDGGRGYREPQKHWFSVHPSQTAARPGRDQRGDADLQPGRLALLLLLLAKHLGPGRHPRRQCERVPRQHVLRV